MIEAERVGVIPIIHPGLSLSLGQNINGPSLIARPAWAPGPGRYMLYFAHHRGQHIRLAFADEPAGPWSVHEPGVLPLSATPLARDRPDRPQPAWAVEAGTDGLYAHLASPDVHLDHGNRLFEMWFHGLAGDGGQVSYRAISSDGLDWQVAGPPTPDTYLRVFTHRGRTYAMARGGRLMWLADDGAFQPGPVPIGRDIRHVAVLVRGDRLHIVYSCIGDDPERICHTELDLAPDWPDWRQDAPETELLRPARSWEGGGLPGSPSRVGAVDFANQLRDPALFVEGETVWLVYAGGGEAALGLARVFGI